MPETYACPHCLDQGFVSLPRRTFHNASLLGHGDCDCVDCRHPTPEARGAHRKFFVAPFEETGRWCRGRALYPCLFCKVGDRFAAWLKEALTSRERVASFRGGRDLRTEPVGIEERMRIGDGLRWLEDNPAPPAPPSSRSAWTPASIPAVAPPDDYELENRRRWLREQADRLLSAA